MLSHLMPGLEGIICAKLRLRFNRIRIMITIKANKTGKMSTKYEDKELRKAMLYAIDREKWIKAFFNGYASESIVLYHLCIG